MYQPKYWSTYFADKVGNKDFVDGIIATVFTFGIWKGAVQTIGSLDIPIYQVINEAEQQLLSGEEENTTNERINNQKTSN